MANEELKEELKEDAKQEALELAEDVTIEAIEHVFNFAVNALNKSKNTMLMALVPILGTVKEYLLGLADKIDGVEG